MPFYWLTFFSKLPGWALFTRFYTLPQAHKWRRYWHRGSLSTTEVWHRSARQILRLGHFGSSGIQAAKRSFSVTGWLTSTTTFPSAFSIKAA